MSKEERKKYEAEKAEALRIEAEKERCVLLFYKFIQKKTTNFHINSCNRMIISIEIFHTVSANWKRSDARSWNNCRMHVNGKNVSYVKIKCDAFNWPKVVIFFRVWSMSDSFNFVYKFANCIVINMWSPVLFQFHAEIRQEIDDIHAQDRKLQEVVIFNFRIKFCTIAFVSISLPLLLLLLF